MEGLCTVPLQLPTAAWPQLPETQGGLPAPQKGVFLRVFAALKQGTVC